MYQVPELLAPAGSLDKLKVAISYGADAVYLGGLKFGLRSAAENFTPVELSQGVEFAHSHGAKVYVVLNGFLHDKDLDELPEFVRLLDELKIDAVIVSDLGVIKTVIENSSIPVHLSTQASCLNVESAKLWKRAGVERVVVGREVSVKEAGKIKREAGIEVEMFVHGSMCMAYSGNCVISNFTQGRDSNRGGCAHSCRFEYSLEFDQMSDVEKKTAFFMSSKDLNGLRLLDQYIEEEIDSIKVEGRMKSHLYAATMSKVYAQALRHYKDNGNFLSDDLKMWDEELSKVTHRTYAQANLEVPAGTDTIFDERETSSDGEYVMVGRVLEVIKDEYIVLEVRNAFNLEDTLEVLEFNGNVQTVKVQKIQTLGAELIERTRPSTLVKIDYVSCQENNIVRMKK